MVTNRQWQPSLFGTCICNNGGRQPVHLPRHKLFCINTSPRHGHSIWVTGLHLRLEKARGAWPHWKPFLVFHLTNPCTYHVTYYFVSMHPQTWTIYIEMTGIHALCVLKPLRAWPYQKPFPSKPYLLMYSR